MENSTGHVLYRAGRLLRYRAARFFKDRGLSISPEQWGLLLSITEKGQPALRELVDGVLNDHANITRLADGLERIGLVRRLPNPADRRSQLIETTPQGHEFIDQVLPDLLQEKAKAFVGLSEEEKSELFRMLRIVQKNME
ncbi:MarR family winged helix-turn-helix transcriptional regulator [Desulfovibrio inopinatus]|uniref:MarR family winged helix-turn-helix transcriptional regulator n=1 Tax=Desulfovibrio inopinatus TaxID=102109 RepID=UPI000687D3D4|nr:MarR family transcriptional regulator [Desulfovibrio inopinatus]